MHIDLTEKVALVCGAGPGGVGLPTALTLAEAGATIVALDHQRALVDRTLDAIAGAGGRAYGIVADLTDPAATAVVVAQAVAQAGRVDLVANVAGGTRPHQWLHLEDTPDAMVQEAFRLNFDYAFTVCRDAALDMRKRDTGGAIVNIASISGLRSAPYHGAYGAAKAGLVALTQTMAIEWARYGIRANCVAPGMVLTDRIRAMGDPTRLVPRPDGRRPVLPQEIANTVLFLLSNLASGISGQSVTVDAALSVNNPCGGLDEFEPNIATGA